MRRKVVISSFHSSSVEYIEEYYPDIIISLDSHLDTFFFGLTGKLLKVADRMPKRLRDAVLRPSTHALMRRVMLDVEIFLAIPWSCLWSDAWGRYKKAMRIAGLEEERSGLKRAVSFQKMFANKLLKIELYTSPPNSLKTLVAKVRRHDLVIDLDVDYMTEFQDECYTQAPRLAIEGVEVTKLGSINNACTLIRLTKPSLITLSEAKLESLKKNSFTGKLLRILQALGYKVEYGETVSSDEEAYSLIEAHESFVNTRLTKIQEKYIASREDMLKQTEKEEEEIARAIKEYFAPLAQKIKQ